MAKPPVPLLALKKLPSQNTIKNKSINLSTLRNKINEFEKNQTNLKTERAKEILQKDVKPKDKNSL
ncbi:MAG: hypothetical protein ACK55Z_05350 [bacterium]